MFSPGARLFVTSFLAVHAELLCIGWVPAYVRFVSYFTDFILLAATSMARYALAALFGAVRHTQFRSAARRTSQTVAWVFVLGLLVSCGAAQPHAVTVTTQAFRFQPSAFEWQAGRPVRLALRNPDGVEHDFVVDALRVTAVSGDGHAQHGPGAGPTPPPNSLHVHAAAFSEATATFIPQSKGTYTVYCSVPGHKELGMTASLVVK